jgi:hypothetical protein
VLLALVDVDAAEVIDEVVDVVVDVAVVEVIKDCGAVLTGDQDARAMAEKVSDGEDPLHPESPQHSQTIVFGFH